jgi:hypothetical protein
MFKAKPARNVVKIPPLKTSAKREIPSLIIARTPQQTMPHVPLQASKDSKG